MTQSVRYTIPGKPIPLRRPRINNKRMYDEQKQQKEVYSIIFKLKQQTPLTGPLTLVLAFVFQYPQSKRKKLNQRTPHDKRPDIDNCIKFVMDAANGVLYNDDAQVCQLLALKLYGPTPKTMIELKPYEYPKEHYGEKED